MSLTSSNSATGSERPELTDQRTRRADHVRRTYVIMSALDYFADMTLAVTSVLLLQSLGMSSGAVFSTIAAVWILEGVSEIPTGVIADMIGRRASVVISFALRAVGYSALFFSDSVSVAVAGTLLGALGGTFASGALEAWAVDEYPDDAPGGLDRLFSHSKLAENGGLVLGVLGGAALGMLDLSLPQLAAGVVCLVGVPAGLLLLTGAGQPSRPPGPPAPAGDPAAPPREPLPAAEARQAPGEAAKGLSAAAVNTVAGIRTAVRGDRVLLALMVTVGVLWLCRGVPGIQWTVVFEDQADGNLLILGAMRCASSLLEIPALWWALRLQARRADARRLILLIATVLGAVALAAAALIPTPAAAMTGYVIFFVAFGLCMPGVRAAVNERIDGRHRATVLSVASLFNSVFTGLGLVAIGLAGAGLASIRFLWPLAAGVFCAAGLTVALLASRDRVTTPATQRMPPC
ncbi:MFS transporter [Streptomyces youssoufiensis]